MANHIDKPLARWGPTSVRRHRANEDVSELNFTVSAPALSEVLRINVDKTVVQKVAYETLSEWLDNQDSRENAYWKMGKALIKSDLRLVAVEVLSFPLIPEQALGLPDPPTRCNGTLSNKKILRISKRLKQHSLIRLAEELGISTSLLRVLLDYVGRVDVVANGVLTAWLNTQPNREVALERLGEALVKSGLELVANEVLGFSSKAAGKTHKRKRTQKNRKAKQQRTQ